MPWTEVSIVQARNAFIDDYLAKRLSMTQLCHLHGISRQTGYKWVHRFSEQGRPGLLDDSRAPRTHPNRTSDELVELVLAARKTHPRWGPRKLKALLERQHPGVTFPAASTIGTVLKSHGLVPPRRVEKRTPPYPSRLEEYERSNKIWCADFKGAVRLRKARVCHPLTISDGHTRYLLCCEALTRTDVSLVKPHFERAFTQFGLPEIIRTDNGPPFASRAPGGLSTLSIWWMKLGITHERIDPGKPTQNGRHERLHRTLKLEACALPRVELRTQQRRFDQFRHQYNDVRPHQALDNKTPASVYEPSSRRYPCRLQQPNYTPRYTLRSVRSGGEVKWQGKLIFVSETLRGEKVGLYWDEPSDMWAMQWWSIFLGHIDKSGKLRRPKPRRRSR